MAFPENPTLGQRLRMRRLELGLRQMDAATMLGVDPKTVMWWERDVREPYVHQYPAIITFLGSEPWAEPRSLPEQLLAFRRRTGLSIAIAAANIGADEGTWRRWEAGEWTPQRRLASRLRLLLASPV